MEWSLDPQKETSKDNRSTENEYSEKIFAQLDAWSEKLIDLSHRNRLISFKPSRSSTLQIIEPSPLKIFDRLIFEEKPWKFFIPPEEEQSEKIVKSDELQCLSENKIPNVLKNLYRRSRSEFEERGVRILYIAMGSLVWDDKNGPVNSPIILVPVDIQRKSALEPYQLTPAKEDYLLNPALEIKMWNDFKIKLPEIIDWEDNQLEKYFTEINQLVKDHGWKVENECWLGLFSFHKLPMYKDLTGNRDTITQHKIVRTLAGIEVIKEQDLIAPKQVDKQLDYRQSYTVLDADSSQLSCIESVKKGCNLVVQGPPGTGKSQTIVNLIAEFISLGNSVLFVSEKMAALEVVFKRLKEKQLDHFCLELHSNQANKRAVVEELDRCLTENLEPKKIMTENDYRKLENKRKQLNDYASAMHSVRERLGLSAFQILTKLISLHEYDYVHSGPMHPKDLSIEKIDQAIELANRLSLRWNVVSERENFPWRGLRILDYSMEMQNKINDSLCSCISAADKLLQDATEYAAILGLPIPSTFGESQWLLELGVYLNRCPGVPEILLTNQENPFYSLRSIDRNDRRWEFIPIVHEYKEGIIKNLDLEKLIKIHSSSLKWFYLQFYLSIIRIKRLNVTKKLPEKILDHLKLALELKKAMEWSELFQSHLGNVAVTKQIAVLAETSENVKPDLTNLKSSLSQYIGAFNHLESYFESGYPKREDTLIRHLPFQVINSNLNEMLTRIEEASDWIDYRKIQNTFTKIELSELFEGLQRLTIDPKSLPKIVEKSLLQDWIDWLFKISSTLNQFQGRQHEQLINEFCELDRMQWQLGPHRVIQNANQFKISAVSHALEYPGSEAHIIRKEAKKKRRHLPLRKLFPQISNILPKLKPCLLMSPLSISQFIRPDSFNFDLVIFDEASQVRTEDAISAIYRGKQIIVFGDEKQLPPTSFFELASDEYSEEAEEDFEEYESILHACEVAGIQKQMLNWHYRSRHESLIAFSNNQFYEKKLITFPSPINTPELGIEFIHVPDGIYDRGGRRDNRKEAEKIVELLKNHFKKSPEKTIGVVSFSISQSNAIEDQVEQLRKDNPDLEKYFDAERFEYCFIKNLENVQGDERDVLIFSVGYGRDQEGHLTMNFGPLNRKGGERRLNVAITRAKEKVYLVSSIKANDFNLETVKAPGVNNLQKYLKYAEQGNKALYSLATEGKDVSPFESAISDEIQKSGFKIIPQIGCSDYRLDIGVINPNNPAEFILAIESDGTNYNSAYTARDRDRLRREVLERLGWHVCKVWVPDFVMRRNTEINRLQNTIKNYTSKNRSQELRNEKKEERIEVNINKTQPSISHTEPIMSWATYYKPHIPEILYNTNYREIYTDPEIANILEEIIEIEGPVHFEIATKRLADTLGVKRINSTFKEVFDRSCQRLKNSHRINRKGDFLWPNKKNLSIEVRRPREEDPRTKRTLNQIPPEEIEEAFIKILHGALSMPREKLMSQVGKVFGYDRLISGNQSSLNSILQKLIQENRIIEKEDRLSIINLKEAMLSDTLSSIKTYPETYCHNCGEKLSKDSRFCLKCGERIKKSINNKQESSRTVRYCKYCGSSLNQSHQYCSICRRAQI